MAPTKKAQEQERVARIRANAAWGAQRSVDAPPKRISEVVEPETITTEVFTPVPAQHERGGPDLSPEAYKHCQFCADFSMDLVPCVKCKKKVCIALKLGGSGCLLKETLPPEMIDSFECPQCHDGPMGVWFQGFAYTGKNKKVLWPVAIITLSLYSTDDGYYASRRMQLDAEHHFRHAPNNLRITHLTMKGNSQRAQQKLVEPTLNFLEEAITAQVPANVVVFIDTHSDDSSGYLQCSGGKTGGSSAPVDEVLNEYIGPKFMDLAAKSSTLAKDLKANEKAFRTQYPDYDGPVLGGQRVLFMMACGPAITKENHLMRVTNLVEKLNMFDLVIGFSGEGTLPEHVMNELLELMRLITTDCGTDLWDVLNTTFKHGEKFLHQCPIVAIFRDNGSVRRIEIGLHEPPSRVLGAKLWCGSSGGQCRPGPGDLTYKTNHAGTAKEAVRQKCRRCGFVSGWVGLKDITWVHLLPGSRRVYWHDYPVTPKQQMAFGSSDETGSEMQPKKREQGMSATDGKEGSPVNAGSTGHEKQRKKRERGISVATGDQAMKKKK